MSGITELMPKVIAKNSRTEYDAKALMFMGCQSLGLVCVILRSAGFILEVIPLTGITGGCVLMSLGDALCLFSFLCIPGDELATLVTVSPELPLYITINI